MIAPSHQEAFGSATIGCKRKRLVIVPCAMKSIVAKRIKKGTKRAKVGEGVQIRSHAPTVPPITLVIPRRSRIGSLFSSSLRNPNSPPNKPGQRATVLVALATFGSIPNHMSRGNVTRVPPPAIELIAPAANAPVNKVASWARDIVFEFRGPGFEFQVSSFELRIRESCAQL